MSGNDAVSSFKAAQLDTLVSLCRDKIESGSSQDEIIAFLHTRGLSFDDAVMTFKKLFSISLGDIHAKFYQHIEWRDYVETGVALLEAFLEGLEDSENPLCNFAE